MPGKYVIVTRQEGEDAEKRTYVLLLKDEKGQHSLQQAETADVWGAGLDDISVAYHTGNAYAAGNMSIANKGTYYLVELGIQTTTARPIRSDIAAWIEVGTRGLTIEKGALEALTAAGLSFPDAKAISPRKEVVAAASPSALPTVAPKPVTPATGTSGSKAAASSSATPPASPTLLPAQPASSQGTRPRGGSDANKGSGKLPKPTPQGQAGRGEETKAFTPKELKEILSRPGIAAPSTPPALLVSGGGAASLPSDAKPTVASSAGASGERSGRDPVRKGSNAAPVRRQPSPAPTGRGISPVRGVGVPPKPTAAVASSSSSPLPPLPAVVNGGVQLRTAPVKTGNGGSPVTVGRTPLRAPMPVPGEVGTPPSPQPSDAQPFPGVFSGRGRSGSNPSSSQSSTRSCVAITTQKKVVWVGKNPADDISVESHFRMAFQDKENMFSQATTPDSIDTIVIRLLGDGSLCVGFGDSKVDVSDGISRAAAFATAIGASNYRPGTERFEGSQYHAVRIASTCVSSFINYPEIEKRLRSAYVFDKAVEGVEDVTDGIRTTGANYVRKLVAKSHNDASFTKMDMATLDTNLATPLRTGLLTAGAIKPKATGFVAALTGQRGSREYTLDTEKFITYIRDETEKLKPSGARAPAAGSGTAAKAAGDGQKGGQQRSLRK